MIFRRRVIVTIFTALTLLTACSQNNGKKAMTAVKEKTITYGAGRFVIDIPVSMHFRGGMYRMRTCNLTETVWNDHDERQSALNAWEAYLKELEILPPPKGKDNAIIEVKKIDNIGRFCNSVLYHKEILDPNFVNLDMLVNSGQVGIWIKLDGKIEQKNIVYDIATEIAKAYRPPIQRLGKAAVLKNVDAFYLEHGAIDLPFEYKESVDIRFNGHKLDQDLALGIETSAVDEVETTGLMQRLAAVITTKFAPGIKIEKIRTGKRAVAGMKGEEIILRTTETEDNAMEINFVFEHLGEKDSGDHPWMKISMTTEDDHVEQKIALWDALLDSMRPAGRSPYGSRPVE